MVLAREIVKANDVRAPEVPRGTAMIVARYRDDNAKVAIVNPADLAMLEESHEMIQAAGKLSGLPISELTLTAHRLEDRPDAGALVEDPAEIAALLDL